MPRPEHVMVVVREWVAKAENDLKNAANTIKMGEECPTDTVCFHAQQCVEKYLKTLLVWKGIPFPKLHNISAVLALIPSDLQITLHVVVRKAWVASQTRDSTGSFKSSSDG